jgi:hypothetical protein
VCYRRFGLSSYPCRRQVWRRRLGLHIRLRCLLVHPYAVVTHQGSRWLEAYCSVFGCWPTHLRDVRRSWLSQASSWRGERGLACSRLFQGCARSCFEHSFSTHVYRGLACSDSGCSGPHSSPGLPRCSGRGSAQQRTGDAGREAHHRGYATAGSSEGCAGISQCLSDG